MLENIQEQDAIEALSAQRLDHRLNALVQIGAKVLFEGALMFHAGQQIDASNTVAILLNFRGENAFAATNIQNLLVGSHHAPRIVVTGILLCLMG